MGYFPPPIPLYGNAKLISIFDMFLQGFYKTENKMTKLWLVTSGSYSDYSVQGVFESKELAQQYIDSFDNTSNDFYWNDLEEIELNAGYVSGYKQFMIIQDTEGNLIEAQQTGSPAAPSFNYWTETYHKIPVFICHCWATDATHAIKICNEKRVTYIVENNL